MLAFLYYRAYLGCHLCKGVSMLASGSLSKFQSDIDLALCWVLDIFDANPNTSENF